MSAPPTRANVMKEAITVVCRIRPLNQTERMKSSATCVTFPSHNSVAVGGKTYTFDVVLQPNATQLEVYEKSVKSIVLSVLNGYNGTIFAYGQTASGKTYTMEGRMKDAEHKGIIPRIIEDIFLHIEKMDENLEFLIKVSYFELYMEKIKDLLDISKTNLPIHETKGRVAYVKGVTERFVSCADDLLDALDEGKMNRHVSVTNMNEHSSRSHSIFRICIQQNNRETGKQLIGSLYLVDLAGSEKVSKSGAEGSTLDEAKNINKSLSTLGNVINALVEGSTHVPYRDSKLTRILQQSLGGNSKTTIIIAASPAVSNELETKSTMVFGVRAKTIKNQVAPNAQLTAEEWRRLYERETDRTRQLFVALVTLDAEVRRWRNGETLSKDQWFTEDNFGKAYGELTCENADSLIHSSLGERATSIAMPLAQDTPTTETPPVSVTNPPKCPTRISAQITEPAEEMQSVEVFRLLDEKDDEINKQCQLVAKLENQLNQTREDYTRATRENDRLQTLLEKVQREADVRRTEVKDVLQALEELAVTYDEKNTQCKKVSKELEEMTTEIAKLKEKLEIHEADAEELKASSAVIKERLKELIYNLNVELSDLGSQLSKVFSHTPPDKSGAVEEQAAVLKLYVLQIKSELQTLIKHDDVRSNDEHSLQGPPLGSSTNLPKSSMDFGGFQRDVERKTKELMNLLKESEKTITRKQSQITQLEAELQMLNKELLQQRSAKQLLTELKQVGGMSEQIFSRIQYAMERTATHIQDQLAKAKGDAQCAHNEADKLKEENIILKVQLERFVTETELLQRRLEGLESGKNEPPIVLKEQAKTELKAMEDTVMHELEVLHSLRRTFITDLKNRVKKNVNKDTSVLDDEPIETQAVGSALQRERIAFLKTSLDNLTKVHKQLVRDNADLRCDIPKLEKRVKASMERIKDLEVALRESKEQMMRDKRRYHQEIERIKEANWARGNARVRINIVKPIRAGQQKDSG